MINLSEKHVTDAAQSVQTISLHLLDLENGRSSKSVNVLLENSGADGWTELATSTINFSGDEQVLAEERLEPGIYRLSINLAAADPESPYPYIPVVFRVADAETNYKISMMLSASGYTVSIEQLSCLHH